jgi:hypothetical protein
MVNPVYTVIVRGGVDPTYRISGDNCDGVYRVDWLSVLPNFDNPHHHSWKLTADFRSELNTTYTLADDAFVFVECSAFSKTGFFDTRRNQASPVVAVAHLDTVYNTTDDYFYHRTERVLPMTVQFPTQNTFGVKLTGLNGETLTHARYTKWVLTLQLEKIV